MAIHLPLPTPPYNGTKEEYKLYYEVIKTRDRAYSAYMKSNTLIGIFSIKKHRHYIKTHNEYRDARKKYSNRKFNV